MFKNLFIVFSFFTVVLSFSAQAEIQITDIAGREVTLNQPARHIVLGEGRFLPTIAILDGENVFSRIVGMMGDFKKYDPASWGQYSNKFPQLEEIPLIGSTGSISFSAEKAFSVKPDLAIFGLSSGHGPSDKNKTIMDQFAAADIPVIIIDFRLDPVVNTPRSIEILGQALGKEEAADEFLNFYNRKMTSIEEKLKNVKTKPSVFMETHVGLRPECCSAFGNGMMGHFIELTGGVNAYGNVIPGAAGMVNVEHLISNQPDIYIGTAIGSAMSMEQSPNFIALGVGTDESLARKSLINSTHRTGVAQLSAIKDKRGYAIWHHFYNTPMHVAAVEAMAKWLHPEIFADLNPDETLKTYFDRFQPVDLDGVYWVGMTE
ncbi:ABC transporter substrate-binding protein [Curvivirga aplysinae]|uniref:ABC transporter substrate-binding protein n=1 Tax=Curvivirga aplysinae TaxID=2529852 RepID=UPI0012BCC3D3|nr:ABC transporter substrate-binding protein [Curvivirga aplysinae]MTI08713.1 Fe3+-hydroxamate ABC transporter substrate-binding protein [Curvivirga aplysinae]